LDVRVYAGSEKAYYARFVEHGTIKMKAKPFLRPAAAGAKSVAAGMLENL
jgi:HK97 gp10 family phage protein